VRRETAPCPESEQGGRQDGWHLALLAAALIVGLGGRLLYSLNTTLWFDETFTGVIASQRSLPALIDWCLHELTGPAFYMPMWLWEKLAGNSDLALRLPNLLLSLATPLAVLRWGHRDARLRRWWAVFLLLWPPILPFAGEARSYPEIFALGVAQAARSCGCSNAPRPGAPAHGPSSPCWPSCATIGTPCPRWCRGWPSLRCTGCARSRHGPR
jgi:hypothetical protein